MIFDCGMCVKLGQCPNGKADKDWSYCGACGLQPIILPIYDHCVINANTPKR